MLASYQKQMNDSVDMRHAPTICMHQDGGMNFSGSLVVHLQHARALAVISDKPHQRVDMGTAFMEK